MLTGTGKFLRVLLTDNEKILKDMAETPGGFCDFIKYALRQLARFLQHSLHIPNA